jgi:hypothetical protein
MARRLRAGRLRRARWVRLVDAIRQLRSPAGRGRVLTHLRHSRRLHQITEYTEAERYPLLFDLAHRLRPDAQRILSFGCSTGEELEAIRRRFPAAVIVGAEINPHSRRIARRKFAGDARVHVRTQVHSSEQFDIIFAMAVLQFKPHWIEDNRIEDLSPFYPFRRFEGEIARLAGLLKPNGLLCVMHAHYRVEDTAAASRLIAIDAAPLRKDDLFRPDGTRYHPVPPTGSMFIASL